MKDSKTFISLCLVGFCSFVSYDMVRRPALALFVESLGAGPFLVGLLVAVSTVTGMVLKLPIGLLSDQINRKRFRQQIILVKQIHIMPQSHRSRDQKKKNQKAAAHGKRPYKNKTL